MTCPPDPGTQRSDAELQISTTHAQRCYGSWTHQNRLAATRRLRSADGLHRRFECLGLRRQHFLLALHRNFRELGESVLVQMLDPPPRYRIGNDMRIEMQEF